MTFNEFCNVRKRYENLTAVFKTRYDALSDSEKKEIDHFHARYVKEQLEHDGIDKINDENAAFYIGYLHPMNLPPYNPCAFRRDGLCEVVDKLFDFYGELNEPVELTESAV